MPKARTISCTSCGAPITLRGFENTAAVACGYCGSVMDPKDPGLRILSQFQAKMKVQPLIPLGRRGRFGDTDFEVIGFLQRQIVVEAVPYSWREYLLFNPYHGFRWLTEYEKHWTFVAPLHRQLSPGKRLTVEDRSYRHFQSAEAEVTFVAGEFTWQVEVGEKARCADYVSPPFVVSSEQSGKEIVWSRGEYLAPEAVWKAFRLEGSPPVPEGVYSCQPNPVRNVRAVGTQAGYAALAALAVLIATLALSANRTVLQQAYEWRKGDPTAVKVTSPFELGGRTSSVAVDYAAQVSNSWIHFATALINDDTGEARDFGSLVEYYAGSDEDGPWSEGKLKARVRLGAVPAGRYYLRIEPEAGVTPVRYQVTVRRDVPQAGHFFAALLLLALPPLFQWVRWKKFEARRWAESDHAGASSE